MRAARLALAGLLLTTACRGSTPDPGEVADRDDVEVGGLPATRIRYGSIDVEGDGASVGALVVVPAGEPPPGGWPVVAYAHGTTGNADDCAPSDDPTLAGVEDALVALAGAGFVAVATDYEGIGTGGPHPYLNGPSAARSLADSVAAARVVVPDAGTRWAVLGYSQGGHAALWAAEVADGFRPELDLLGAVAQAPVTEPAELLAAGGPRVAALAIAGWMASVPDLDEDELLTDAGRDAADAAEDECLVEIDDPVLLTEAGTAGLDAYLAENTPGGQPAVVPVLVLQGTVDPLVRPEVTRRAVDRLCASGSTVELREFDDAEHVTIPEVSMGDAIAWLTDRFAGAPADSTC